MGNTLVPQPDTCGREGVASPPPTTGPASGPTSLEEGFWTDWCLPDAAPQPKQGEPLALAGSSAC
ncbi:MAG: hypothetical protein ACLGI2_11320 [Acidimicrobiia bacterium]